MVEETIIAGLVVAFRPPLGPWSEPSWAPFQVLPDAPATPAWTLLAKTSERTTWYAGPVEISLYSTDTANYRDNLTSGRPSLWVALRTTGTEPPVEIAAVTADPAEGEALTETGTNTVEMVEMPSAIAAAVAAFVTAHHVERVFEKRRRDRRQPDMLGQRGPAGDRNRSSGHE
jgi:hypothetical protein